MRVDGLIPLPHKAEYWEYTTSQNDAGDLVRDYFKADDIQMMLSEQQGNMLAFTRELLVFDGQLRNVQDQRGTNILDFGGDAAVYFFVGSPSAQFDVFGNLMGYRYDVTKMVGGTTVVNI